MTVESLINDSFEIDLARPIAGAGGGLPAFAAIDRRDGRAGLMAVQCRRGAPPRALALTQLTAAGIDGMLSPLAHGPGRDPAGNAAWFVICPAPPGRSLAGRADRIFPAWQEREILDCVLRPVAHALEELQSRRLTHRGIRPDNLFRVGVGEPAVLGCAWAGPPAALQPAVYEPPYSAQCLPGGRGDGGIADDIYALGVILIALALGRVPMAGEDAATIVLRKLEQGSFNALVGEERLPPIISDIVRGMLAEDPEHRPPPALLGDLAGARTRRVAARPPRRAQRELEIGNLRVWTARTLAFGIAADPDAGVRALRSATVDRWIRRSLGDGLLAARLEEAVRVRAAQGGAEDRREDAVLAMRAVAILDPLAPLCWGGIAFWPDGFGPVLAEDEPAGALPPDIVGDIVTTEAIGMWGAARPERCDPPSLRLDAHQCRTVLRARGWGGGIERLRYALNPLLACRSALLQSGLVVRLTDVLPTLERRAATERTAELPIDRDLAAFIAARSDARLDGELAQLTDAQKPEASALAVLRLYSAVQLRSRGPALPALATWLADRSKPALGAFHGRAQREQREVALGELAGLGRLAALLAMFADHAALAADRAGHEAALAQAAEIDRQLAALAAGGGGREVIARRLARDSVAALGAAGLMLAIMFALFA